MVKPNGAVPVARVDTPEPVADADTAERILDGAHRVFLRRGTAGARTQEIAAEAGVNKALVHYYFGTKATLADAVFRRAAATLLPSIFGVLGNPALSLEERVWALAERQVAFHRAHPYLAIYLLSEVHTAPERLDSLIGAHGRPSLDALRRQVDAAIAEGTIRPITVEHFLVHLISMLVFPVVARPIVRHVLAMSDDAYDAFLDERVEQAATFFLSGLRP